MNDLHPEPESPPVDSPAYRGILGAAIRTISPHTEADPMAILVQLMTAVGVMMGRGLRLFVDGCYHYAIIHALILGRSSRARKGTSLGWVNQFVALIDLVCPAWQTFCA